MVLSRHGGFSQVTQLTPAAGEQLGERRRRRGVGEQHIDLVETGQLDHCRPVELAVIGGEPDLARVLDDGARHFHLAVVEVAQAAVALDPGDADQPDVDPELANEVDRRLADDAAIARADDAAGDDHLAVGIVREDRRDIEVVGDHAQTLVMEQLVGDRFGRGADVDDQRATRRHGRGHRAGDAFAWPRDGCAGAGDRRCSRSSSSARARHHGSAPRGRRRPGA